MINGYRIILPMLVLLATCPSFALAADHAGSQDTANSPANAIGNTSASNATDSAVPNLKYIWSVTGIESGQVTMVLDQEGREIFGRAKYEPEVGEPWNAIVVGEAVGDQVTLVITALQGDEQVSTMLSGTYDQAAEKMGGPFFQVSHGRVSARGEFEAQWINPDTSAYAPAEVKESKPVTLPSETNISTSLQQISGQQTSPKSKYHDVRQDADRILTGVGDISQIPIGMSGLTPP